MVAAVEAKKERIPIWLADTAMGRIGRPEEVARSSSLHPERQAL
ncbi:hypothetical protein EV286_11538 [Rhizobium sp. BK251]|nr:hypothetical protein EV286_11538 [Rhizobium sp. BK251]